MYIKDILIVLELVFLSVVVSLDNAILIGLFIKDEKKKNKKIIAFFGSLLGSLLRLFFAFLFYFILSEDISVIYIMGGLFVIIAGLLVLNDSNHKKDNDKEKPASIIKIIISIFLIDTLLSFDNSISIADQVHHITKDLHNNATLIASLIIVFCTLISFPIVYFGSTSFSEVLKDNKILVYVSSYLLVSIGVGMFMEDPVLSGVFTDLNIYIYLVIQYGVALFLVFSWMGMKILLNKR